ncbi:cupin domain-containing protein [Shewanella sp. KT0246]|uniref:cupin domain-containing protein n=1 Tax=Shewanella sp. KT0246 TaxID=2815912 RepID=UPI001BC68162|nr:cupin domain-containing protein [Shewanella sp. KT0246]GIU48272.1 cupin [Shewanella sp. KT0246]
MDTINMDFTQRVVVNTHELNWDKSPAKGVWRKRLAREEAERGHATSVVKYDAGANFKSHPHPLGEEIFVLSGIFSDETGDYPAGTYIRNPEGFSHAPFSEQGCELLVKLHQFLPSDKEQVRVDTRNTDWLPGQGELQVMRLHQHLTESTALVFWPAGCQFQSHRHFGGEEVYVISGEFIDEHGRYPAGSWIRSPHLSQHNPYVEQDTVILVKVGHLNTDE